MSITPLYRTIVGFTRTRSRKSLMAAAAVAGVLGTASASAAVMPWGHAPGSAASTSDTTTSAGKAAARAADSRQGKAGLTALRAPGAVGSVVSSAKQSPARKAPAKQSAAKHATAPAKVKAHEAHKAHMAHMAKSRRHVSTKPYLIYDSVTPSAIPAGKTAAVYVNGSYAASSAQVAGHKSVLWIDTNGSNPAAHALDVEPGDATPAVAAQWVRARLRSRPHAVAIVYTMRSQWGAVKNSVSGLPKRMRSHVRYWIADPTGVPHIVPGSDATQWYWGQSYDITTAKPSFQR